MSEPQESGKLRRAREKAVVWFMMRVGYTKEDGLRNGWRRGSKWEKKNKDKNTETNKSRKKLEEEENNNADALSRISSSSEETDDHDRETYIGRRTSIGSVERNDSTALFGILDDLKDSKDPKKSIVDLGRLRKNILARYGDSR